MNRNAVYEVFVDSFAGCAGEPLQPPCDNSRPWNHHCGGRLDGISARLDHIVSLGADAIYLTPIFKAGSNHKYDTTSYDEVDPLFGGDAAFEKLAEECAQRGVGLILDGVFNHVGQQHDWFKEATSKENSRSVEFFKWNEYPSSYNCWRGHRSLPELKLASEEVARVLLDGEQSVVRRWLRRGATGWRLDCANDLGLEACSRATAAAAQENAADGVIGELMSYAAQWAQPGILDGVMNYWVRETILSLSEGKITAAQAALNFDTMAREYGMEQLLHSWNVLATHDTPRLGTVLPDPRKRVFAMTLAFSLPGIPFIYYGDEIGMKGNGDPDCRAPMVWKEECWEPETIAVVKRLTTLRSKARALQSGAMVMMPQAGKPELLAFARVTEDPSEVLIVVANASDAALSARVFAPYSYLFDALPMRDLTGEAPETQMVSGRFDILLPAWTSAIYCVEPNTIPGYSFFG